MSFMQRRRVVAGMGALFAGGLLAGAVRAAMNPDDKFDLVVKGGELLDPSQNLRAKRDIGMRFGKIEALDADIPASRALRILDASGRLVLPGLVDLRIQQPADQPEINVEVDPLPLGRHLKLLVPPDVLEVRPNEKLCDVPVPKLVGFLLGVRRGFEIQLLIGANKQEVKIVPRPASTDFGAIAGNYFPVRIFVHGDAGRVAPELRRRVEIQRDILVCLHAVDHRRLRRESEDGKEQNQREAFTEAIHRDAPSRRRHLVNADSIRTRDRFPRFGPKTDPRRDQDTSGLRANPVAAKSHEFRGRTREIDSLGQKLRNLRL